MSLSQKLTKKLTNQHNPNAIILRVRRRRIGALRDLIAGIHAQKGAVRIIDLGGTKRYWNVFPPAFLSEHNVHITVVNLLGDQPPNDERFTFVQGDACRLSAYADGAFDLVHSNSTIEHLGEWPNMMAFAGEVRRLAPAYYLQTPNYWFPFEPHCMTPLFHWLPRPMRVWLIMHFTLGHWNRSPNLNDAVKLVDSARLLNKAMVTHLFPDAEIRTDWFLGLPKSLMAIRRRAA